MLANRYAFKLRNLPNNKNIIRIAKKEKRGRMNKIRSIDKK